MQVLPSIPTQMDAEPLGARGVGTAKVAVMDLNVPCRNKRSFKALGKWYKQEVDSTLLQPNYNCTALAMRW